MPKIGYHERILSSAFSYIERNGPSQARTIAGHINTNKLAGYSGVTRTSLGKLLKGDERFIISGWTNRNAAIWDIKKY